MVSSPSARVSQTSVAIGTHPPLIEQFRVRRGGGSWQPSRKFDGDATHPLTYVRGSDWPILLE